MIKLVFSISYFTITCNPLNYELIQYFLKTHISVITFVIWATIEQ